MQVAQLADATVSQPRLKRAAAIASQHGRHGQLLGGPATVVRRLKEMQAASGVGVVDPVIQGPALADEKMLRSVELFGTKGHPQVQDVSLT